MDNTRERISVVIAGHVDHGKSTVLGRLLADTGLLAEGKIDAVRRACEKNSKPFEYAFLLDALKDEQSQGITIDSARVFFKTAKRDYLIIDAPGHIEFLKNMVSGASRAEAAILVIDAKEGVRENTRRHGYLLSMLGIRQLAVVINKMDLVGYSEERFRSIAAECKSFLKESGIVPMEIVPASGLHGENISKPSVRMSWYKGATVLRALDSFRKEPLPVEKPFRMPVQDVYKFTGFGDDRRIIAGTPESGRISAGDGVVFYPSGKKSRVAAIEAFPSSGKGACEAGLASGFTLEEQIYVTRGEVAARDSEPKPEVASRFKVRLFWMGRQPLEKGRFYSFKIGTSKTRAEVEFIPRTMRIAKNSATFDFSVTENAPRVERHEIAECILRTVRQVVFGASGDDPSSMRFVLVDGYEVAGGGTVLGPEGAPGGELKELVVTRELKWIKSSISSGIRASRHHQKPFLIIVTGPEESPRKEIGRALEQELYAKGFDAYFLGFGSVLYGVDADLKRPRGDHARDTDGRSGNDHIPELPHVRFEHIRRLGEIANILLDAGLILIVTAIALTEEDLAILRTTLAPGKIMTVRVGPLATDLKCDVALDQSARVEVSVETLVKELAKRSVIQS